MYTFSYELSKNMAENLNSILEYNLVYEFVQKHGWKLKFNTTLYPVKHISNIYLYIVQIKKSYPVYINFYKLKQNIFFP